MAFNIKSPSLVFQHAALPAAITLEHRPDAAPRVMDADGTCDRLWPTSLALSMYLCENPSLVAGKRVVELGSGTGAVGIVCAALGAASVTLTDMPEALDLIQQNAQQNPQASCVMRVAPCTWGDEEHVRALLSDGAYDIVLCCEVVYQQSADVLVALAQTQRALAQPLSGKVLLAYEFRGALSEDLAYFEAATDAFGDSTSTPLTGDAAQQAMGDHHEDDGSGDRFLYTYDVPTAAQAPPANSTT